MKYNALRLLSALIVEMFLATTVYGAQLTLTWTDNSTDESGFKIERKAGQAGAFAEVATVATDTILFVDPGLPEGQEFCYRVRAYNNGGDSAYTNEDCSTTIITPPIPTAPSGVTVIFQINLP